MRAIRLHLVGVLVVLIGVATSMPQLPARHHAHALRNPAPVQLDDDDDDRDGESAVLDEEAALREAASGGRRRRA